MKIRVLVNVAVAYCNAEKVAEYLDQLNYFESAKALDSEHVELIMSEDDLLMLYKEEGTFERIIRDALDKFTEAAKGVYVYQALDFDDVIDEVEVIDVDSIDDVINSRLFEIHENELCDELAAISELAIDDVILADRMIHAIAERFGLKTADRMNSADVILLCRE